MINIVNKTLHAGFNELWSSQNINSLLITPGKEILMASSKGSITVLPPSLHISNNEIQLINSYPINQLQLISTNFIVALTNGQVHIFDLVTFGLCESLPFNNILMFDVLLKDNENSILVILTKNNQIIFYEFNDVSNSLEMAKQIKINEKLNYLKIISHIELIYATNSGSFHSLSFQLHPSSSQEDTSEDKILCDLGRNGMFSTQNIDIVKKDNDNGYEILISKGINAIKLNQNLKIMKDTFQWEHTPKRVILFDPFVLMITSNHIHIKDLHSLHTLQLLEISNIQQVIPNGDSLIVFTKKDIFKYQRLDYDLILDQLELKPAIGLIKQLSHEQISNKFLKLRELEILNALRQLNHPTSSNLKRTIDTLSDFVCPPFIVISLFPQSLTGLDNNSHITIPKRKLTSSSPSEDAHPIHIDINHTSIHLLTFYITDIRRKLNKLLNSEEQKVQLDDNQGLLTLDFFINDEIDFFRSPSKVTNRSDDINHYSSTSSHTHHSVKEIQILLDTTLFQCYAEINTGLIGSLVRLDNYCDVNLVEKSLKSKGFINELIDFYFKKNEHEKALNLLWDLIIEKNLEHISEDDTTAELRSTDDSITNLKGKTDPMLLVKYLQRLNNDQIDLILKYTKLLISIDLNYGIETLISSQNSDVFDRSKIWKFLTSIDDVENIQFLQRIYLEYIIIELKEDAVFYNTKLAEIYLSNLVKDNFEVDSINYKKLYGFLQDGNFDLSDILTKIDKLHNKSNHILLLKTFILSRLERYTEVLNIYVKDINDPILSIHYLSKIYEATNESAGEKYYLELIKIFWENNKDKESILKLLTHSKYSSKISLVNILQVLPNDNTFKIKELENFLVKNLRIQRTKYNVTNLKKTLLDISNLKVEEVFLNDSNFKFDVVKDEEKCFICDGLLGNSVINCIPLNKGAHDLYSNDFNIDKLKELTTSKNGKIFENKNNGKKYILVHFGCTKKVYNINKKIEDNKLILRSISLKDYKNGEYTTINSKF